MINLHERILLDPAGISPNMMLYLLLRFTLTIIHNICFCSYNRKENYLDKWIITISNILLVVTYCFSHLCRMIWACVIRKLHKGPFGALYICFVDITEMKIIWISGALHILTLVLLNPDLSCLCKQCRSRSVGFSRSQLIWICTVCH